MANADMVTQAITRQGPGPRTQNCGMKAQTACGGHSAGQAMEPRLGQNGGAIATKLHSQPPVETTGRTTGRGSSIAFAMVDFSDNGSFRAQCRTRRLAPEAGK